MPWLTTKIHSLEYAAPRMGGEMAMRKSQLLLAVLLLFLGLVLCAFSVIVVFAVIQVVRSSGQVWVFPPTGGAA